MKSYYEMVHDDVISWIGDNEWKVLGTPKNEMYRFLRGCLWNEGSVTGNDENGYCSQKEAGEYVENDIYTVYKALNEMNIPAQVIKEKFINHDWVWLDCFTRYYILSSVLFDVIEEMEKVKYFDYD